MHCDAMATEQWWTPTESERKRERVPVLFWIINTELHSDPFNSIQKKKLKFLNYIHVEIGNLADLSEFMIDSNNTILWSKARLIENMSESEPL